MAVRTPRRTQLAVKLFDVALARLLEPQDIQPRDDVVVDRPLVLVMVGGRLTGPGAPVSIEVLKEPRARAQRPVSAEASPLSLEPSASLPVLTT